MNTIISENLKNTQRYIPHTLETRLAAVKTYRNNNSINFICRRYKISKASLMRWNKKYNGTKESLMDKSHKPHSPHTNAHTLEELTWIKNLIKRNPDISMIELYAKLKFNKGYKIHPCSLFRILRKLGFYKDVEKKTEESEGGTISGTLGGNAWASGIEERTLELAKRYDKIHKK